MRPGSPRGAFLRQAGGGAAAGRAEAGALGPARRPWVRGRAARALQGGEKGDGAVLGRFRCVFGACSPSGCAVFAAAALPGRLVESCAPRAAAALPARWSGSCSALGSILGIPAEKLPSALGQHPPPVATSKGEWYQLLPGSQRWDGRSRPAVGF